ncbi:MAG: hypothetical protein V8S82_00130 [Eubacteriales bacterium]
MLALYRSVLVTEGCTWDEDYPSEREAKGDLSSGGLYVFESDGRLLVSRVNLAAVGLYRSLGFDFVGNCHEYGIDFFACEKAL